MSTCVEYNKCGDVLTAFQSKEINFVLNCFFCLENFTQLDHFATHIREQHSDWIKKFNNDIVVSNKNEDNNVVEGQQKQQVEVSRWNIIYLSFLTNFFF